MSTSGDSTPRIRLRVQADDRGAKIVVNDAGFGLASPRELKHMGSFEDSLSPGVYRIRVDAGNASRETFAILDPAGSRAVGSSAGITAHGEAGSLTVRFSALAVDSVAPISQSGIPDEPEIGEAGRHSRKVPARIREGGSRLYLFARRRRRGLKPSRSDRRTDRSSDESGTLTADVSLTDAAGNVVCEFADGERQEAGGTEFVAHHLELPPGAYLIQASRARSGAGPACMARTVICSGGWQTQLFLERGGEDAAAALARMSVHMGRAGFAPDHPDVRRAEIACAALALQRPALSDDEVDPLVSGKFDNPVLGILGGHFLHRRESLATLKIVVDNLRGMLNEPGFPKVPHPDVEALALAAGMTVDGDDAFHVPPLLIASWEIVSAESRERPELIPAESLSARVAAWLWGDGPWLLFAQPEDERGEAPKANSLHAGSGTPAPVLESFGVDTRGREDDDLARVRETILRLKPTRDALSPAGLDRAERALVLWLGRRLDVDPEEIESPVQQASRSALSIRDLAREHALPPSTVRRMLRSIARKLDRLPGPRRSGEADRSLSTRSCVAFFPGSPSPEMSRRARSDASRWLPGQTIGVSFLNGPAALRDRVREIATTWTSPRRANLRLDFRADPHAGDIRVGFYPGGSWSVVGTSCRDVAPREPTLNFGWIDENSPDAVLRAIVLHEFGHALGLMHALRIPSSGIRWDKAAVYADLALEGWSRARVDADFFRDFEEAAAVAAPFDPQSIMLCPIKSSWTLDGFEVPWNTDLSIGDGDLIRKHYPP